MHIDKELKEKLINNQYINDKELTEFINYIIYKSNIITKHIPYKKIYTKINLCNEILWSHNIESNIYNINNHYYLIFIINNNHYLLDINYNNKELNFLKEHKYILLNNDIYNKYINIIGG